MKAQRELEVHSGRLNFHISPFNVSTSNDTRWLYGVHLLRSSLCSSYSKSKTKTPLCRERLSLLYGDDVKENSMLTSLAWATGDLIGFDSDYGHSGGDPKTLHHNLVVGSRKATSARTQTPSSRKIGETRPGLPARSRGISP